MAVSPDANDLELLDVILCRQDGDRAVSTTVQTLWTHTSRRLELAFMTLSETTRAVRPTSETDQRKVVNYAEFKGIIEVCLQTMGQSKNASLLDIAMVLNERTLVSFDEEATVRSCQLCFIAVGILSGLYDADLVPGPDILALAPAPVHDATSAPLAEVWKIDSLTVAEAQGSLADILRLFAGGRGPVPMYANLSERRRLQFPDALYVSNLSYYIITKLGQIKIVGTDSLCMHLQLDRRNRTLAMYSRPSLCALMCSSDFPHTWMDG